MLKPGMQRVLGTSTRPDLDGVEAAVIVTDGQTVAEFGPATFRAFTAAERRLLDDPSEAAAMVELAHAEAVAALGPVDLIGFAGPNRGRDALGRPVDPLGSGQVLAQVLECPVVWDFAGADQRFGGLGQPLAAFFHHALTRHLGLSAPVLILDLGAVTSLTWCDPRHAAPESACLAFEPGPGLMPSAGALGTPDAAVLETFAAAEVFRRMPPKLFDPSALPDLGALTAADRRATHLALIATGISLSFEHFPEPPRHLLVTGPGRTHGALLAMIAAGCDLTPEPFEDHGLDGTVTAAQAIAFLAMRVRRGLPTTAPGTTGVAAPVGGGTLSQP